MAEQHTVRFPSDHIVTFPEGMDEKEVARQAAHMHYFSLSKLGKGAPADFGGPVFPNPKGIKPQLDTARPKPKATNPKGLKMDIQNAPVSGTKPPLTKEPANAPHMDVRPSEFPGVSTGLVEQ